MGLVKLSVHAIVLFANKLQLIWTEARSKLFITSSIKLPIIKIRFCSMVSRPVTFDHIPPRVQLGDWLVFDRTYILNIYLLILLRLRYSDSPGPDNRSPLIIYLFSYQLHDHIGFCVFTFGQLRSHQSRTFPRLVIPYQYINLAL